MAKSLASIIDVDMSEIIAIQSYADPSDGDAFEQYETKLNEYLHHLVDLHMDRQILYNMGVVGSFDFVPESMHDVYHSNLYYMLWFYEDEYPFERWDNEYDSWLADLLI